ncbi:CDGSH iron-sulfur domain-containing protein [Bacillus benzoevorans]|uniref:CDGSH-type Zn-finger protein n=1 Tax=Bacillus benzoevorans TaxID=1456 RepID=A0A7X0HUV9_9BACI|nr:CDGSH iron-sulfur domain-containing protein [Bacillus benzoevorans]MBB6446105.1 CDGSH-type Zn-finger protein [Bacillus benzoevorans]
MSEMQFLDDGPILAKGMTLLDGAGNKMEAKEEAYLCRCGLSDNKPYCNGAHKGKFDSDVRA